MSGPLPFEDGRSPRSCAPPPFITSRARARHVAEMSRVLAPGGRLVIADANRRHPVVFALDLVLRVAQPQPRRLPLARAAHARPVRGRVCQRLVLHGPVAQLRVRPRREGPPLSAHELERLTAPALRRLLAAGSPR